MNHTEFREGVPAYKRPSTEKFHTSAVKIGQNKNNIGKIIIIKDPLRKLESHLEKWVKRKKAYASMLFTFPFQYLNKF